MIIRKLYKFENAHIVRNCSTRRCSENIHGHSYKVEILLESNFLDNGEMVYDFGLMKLMIKEMIDSFDHAITIWDQDSKEYIEAMQRFSNRWILTPFNPSAEQFARAFFLIVDKILTQTQMQNGEKDVKVNSIIVHETDSGYAQAFREDAYSKLMGEIDLKRVIFSKAIKEEWSDFEMWDKLLAGKLFKNPQKI